MLLTVFHVLIYFPQLSFQLSFGLMVLKNDTKVTSFQTLQVFD